MKAEIIAVGSELLTPFRQDTNSLFLTERLNELGVEVHFKTVVGDSRADLVAVARIAMTRADIVILMGGLGPTEDDLTRECVAEALGIELHRDPEIITELYKRFAERRMKMPENNTRQADVLDGAVLLRNPNGTAPAQWLQTNWEGDRRYLMLLPGPPQELKPLFDSQCLPRLKEVLPPQFISKRVLKVAMGESACDARIAPLYTKVPNVQTTILAHGGEVEIHLQSRADRQEEAERRVEELAGELEEELDDCVISSGGESLEQIVGYYLQMRGATLAVAESCSGGMMAERITSVPGSSRYFLGGAVVYSNELKTKLAGVPAKLIAEHGAVSREVAVALAEGIRERTKATFGVGITGIAGPTGGTPEKPVGLVYIALSDGKDNEVVERRLHGDRERIRLWASFTGLDLIRRKLI
ncbi:MAG: competence/damage-inducible protein A [Acidobacteria bacterium]|nr:MAG: competence/damage-inducible protein A [Acidobacteriota bacterium]PYY15878.1 MAG: competence/damage-inducible protein A [Acidobacteriota bacterium]